MTREKCCGSFPEFVCGDCPHANADQKTTGGVSYTFQGTGPRCSGCFSPRAEHAGGTVCPPPRPAAPPPPPPPAPVQALAAAPAARRLPTCPSCHKPWNGQRMPRPSPEGVFCGTCNQQAFFE